MSAQPTPFPADTWHIPTDGMYPAIMDKLAELSDQVKALRTEAAALRLDVSVLRIELRSLRFAVLGFVAVVVMGLAGFGLVARLR